MATRNINIAPDMSGLGDAATLDVGTTAGTVAAGDDSRLSDARTPTTHAASHGDGGGDEISIDGSQVTTGFVSVAKLGSGSASSVTYLRGDGAWSPLSASVVPVDASGFNGNLVTSDDTVQKVAQKVDDLTIPTGVLVYTKSLAATETAYSNLGTHANVSTLHGLTAANRRVWVPVFVRADTFNRISVNVVTGAISTWRVGLHVDDGGWPASAVLADYGTNDMSGAAGFRTLTISQVTSTGWYWVQIQADSYTATPTVTGVNGQNGWSQMPLGFPTQRASFQRSNSGFFDTGGTGGALAAAPASLATAGVTPSADVPRVWLWRA